jgi:hypothetical protein
MWGLRTLAPLPGVIGASASPRHDLGRTITRVIVDLKRIED